VPVWLKVFLISPRERKSGRHDDPPALAQEKEPTVSVRRKIDGRSGKEKKFYHHPTGYAVAQLV
jgi:hypothetical protein